MFLGCVQEAEKPKTPAGASEIYSLKALEVILDQVSEEGYNYYIIMLEARYSGDKSWHFNPLYITLVSDAGYKYNEAFSLPVRQSLPAVELKKGEAVKGQIVFKLPKNEKPAKLVYDDILLRIKFEITDIPEPAKQVSYIYFAETNVQSKYSLITAYASVKSGSVYYSSEPVKVDVEVMYSKGFGSLDTIQIKSITVKDFEITKIYPSLPLRLKDGEKATISLELKAPQKGYKGNMKLTIVAE